jgi:hypothetical protein
MFENLGRVVVYLATFGAKIMLVSVEEPFCDVLSMLY